ncbi:MAG: PfkB family carbohydrate kinase [Thermoprotei archaeon]
MFEVLEFASIGNANIDVVFRVKGIPELDSIAQASEGFVGTGGSASNYAYTIVKMGAKASFIGCVGDDVFGRVFVEELSSIGVDTRFVEVVKNERTGLVTIWLDDSGEKRGVAWRGANKHLAPKPEWMALNKMSFVHLAGCSPSVAKWVWDNIGAPKSFDPGSSTHLYTPELLIEALKACRVSYMSTHTLNALGINRGNLNELLASNGNILVEKMGGGGVKLHTGGKGVWVPALKARPVDTTGAGDVFSAVFDFKIASGSPPEEAAIWATAASAIKISKLGAKSGVPNHDELESYVHKVKENITPTTV